MTICPGGPDAFGFIEIRSQLRQRFDGGVEVELPGIGVDVHRQVDCRMTHRGLRDARRNATLAQMRSNRCSQSVNVQSSPVIV